MTSRSAVALIPLVLLACAGSGASGDSVVLKGQRFAVEIVDSPEEQQRGLMFREQMDADAGMLFVYAAPEPQAFWMKNTRIPLDILFFDDRARYLGGQLNVPTCRGDPCPSYPGPAPARYVLELNAGRAEALGLQPGDTLDLPSTLTEGAPKP
ncbi:MAG: DUF192 domain-containing protein [Lysobacterales bacterium]